ncbi:MAG: metal ABC transporter permease, partial [Emcibacteraceae bacterium]|nr:metal ABC transporter permease [Emcibacteraceae bacterium]
SIAGILSVLCGVWASSEWDVPTGPAIVLSATILFLCGRFLVIRRS